MATITDLTVQKRDSDRINVYLDGQFAIGLEASVAAGLRVGQQLTADEVENLRRKEQLEKAKQNAAKLISLRPRSEFEVRTSLHVKGFEESIIDRVIEQLTSREMLDDVAFANYWVEQRETFRPRSRFALSQELRQKGVSRDVIDAALERVDESTAAHRAAEKRASQWAGLPEEAFKNRLAGYLQRRGFSFEIIEETLDDVWRAMQED